MIEWDPEINKVREIKNKWKEIILSLPNVNGIGVGRKNDKYCLHILVTKKLPLSKLRRDEIIPPECDGIQTDVIVSGHISSQ